MKHPKIDTKVIHSESKNAWNVIGIRLGGKYKIARVPYLVIDGNERQSLIEKNEALRHAEFISYCFNKPDKVLLPKPPKSTPPEHIICKGSIVLGTGCGVCSKCLQELEKQKS